MKWAYCVYLSGLGLESYFIFKEQMQVTCPKSGTFSKFLAKKITKCLLLKKYKSEDNMNESHRYEAALGRNICMLNKESYLYLKKKSMSPKIFIYVYIRVCVCVVCPWLQNFYDTF